jgi:hypothetical protein
MLDDLQLQSEPQPGAVIEWRGRPNPRAVFSAGDYLLIRFSLLWGGFAIFWETTVLLAGAPLILALWGIPFVALGLYLIFGQFPVASWMRRPTWYAGTIQRAIILTRVFGGKVQSFYFSALAQLEKRVSSRGRGSVLLGSSAYFGLFSSASWPSGYGRDRRAPGFYNIPDAQDVFDLITRHRHVWPG